MNLRASHVLPAQDGVSVIVLRPAEPEAGLPKLSPGDALKRTDGGFLFVVSAEPFSTGRGVMVSLRAVPEVEDDELLTWAGELVPPKVAAPLPTAPPERKRYRVQDLSDWGEIEPRLRNSLCPLGSFAVHLYDIAGDDFVWTNGPHRTPDGRVYTVCCTIGTGIPPPYALAIIHPHEGVRPIEEGDELEKLPEGLALAR